MVGAATLQREVLVELLENRVHSPTVADANAPVSADAPQRVRRQFLQRQIAVDGHGEVGLGQQRAQHVHDAVDAAEARP